MPGSDDQLTATLAEIRDDADSFIIDSDEDCAEVRVSCLGHNALRVIAALDALLVLHQPGRTAILGSLCKRHENHRHFSITRTEADDVRACPDCAARVYTSCAGCGPHTSVDACPVRLIITRELTKRGPDHA